MTPELKTACEVVFQEHKVSAQPIKWDRDAFRGRISIGLSEMAKETLVKKNIILLPNKAKKIFTHLNPEVATAGSFEEAEKIIETKIPGLTSTLNYNANKYIDDHVFGYSTTPVTFRARELQPVRETLASPVPAMKWYLKPVFLYVVWPVCGAAAGALISRLMDMAYTGLFLNAK